MRRSLAPLPEQGNPAIVMALAGNKADLAEESRAVETAEAAEYAASNGLIFMETSAKVRPGSTVRP